MKAGDEVYIRVGEPPTEEDIRLFPNDGVGIICKMTIKSVTPINARDEVIVFNEPLPESVIPGCRIVKAN